MLKFVSNNELLLYLMIFFFHSQHYQPRIINYYCKKKFRTLIFSPSLYIDAYNSLAQCTKNRPAPVLLSHITCKYCGGFSIWLPENFWRLHFSFVWDFLYLFLLSTVRPPSIVLLVVQNYILGDDYGYLATTRWGYIKIPKNSFLSHHSGVKQCVNNQAAGWKWVL